MAISFDEAKKCFYLSGGNVSYVLHVDEKGRLLNLHWGKKVQAGSVTPDLSGYPGFASFDLPEYLLPHEVPVRGSGWYGTPAVDVLNAQGNDVVVLKVVSHSIFSGKKGIHGLPATYVEADDEAQSLEILLADELTGLKATVNYSIYLASGVITRSIKLENGGKEALTLKGLMSASVPLYGKNYDVVHLKGAWSRERQIVRTPAGQAEYRVFSQRGASGHEENPFIALCERSTTEQAGSVWAMNLVYSGSFLANAAVDNADNIRFGIGLNPDCFSWKLEPGEEFCAPEAVMVYSDAGFNGMSQKYHELYRTRLVRGEWRDKVRPILINNWEGTYFDFNEEKILDIARRAKEIGIEMFVLDDGWFGKRNIDNCSLGDWVVNTEKLPHGMNGLADRIHELGLKFGLWFEPEMISPDSDLYRAHEDWCLHVDGRERTLERSQLMLDLSRKDVQDYVIEAVSSVLATAAIDYVKWDYNRNMTEAFSGAQKPERQMETQHRYILGLYRVMEEITGRFPHVLFESCSGGGGRFDAGMLYYMPQTWTSDNTDAISRLSIQYGTSYVYPISAIGAHVSAVPNHQTGRVTGMQIRGDVAMAGNFGFELDLAKLSREDLATAAALVEKVKAVREITQKGTFTRLISPLDSEYAAWQFVSADESQVMLCVYHMLITPNMPPVKVCMNGLDADALYEAEDGNRYTGAALMNVGIWIKLDRDFTSCVKGFKKV